MAWDKHIYTVARPIDPLHDPNLQPPTPARFLVRAAAKTNFSV